MSGHEQLLDDQEEQGPIRSWWEICCTGLGLGCCIDEDKFKKRPLAEVVQNSGRHCTDIPCCLILILWIIADLVLVFYASDNGANPDYLMYGTDYAGELCDGSSQRAAWADISTSTEVMVCVDGCDASQTSSDMAVHYPSDSFLNAWCIPTSDYIENNATVFNFGDSNDALTRAVSDINTTKWLILISAIICIIISFIYIHFISFFGRILVWLSIVATFVGGALMGAYLIKTGLDDMDTDTSKSMGKCELGVGIAVFVLLFCFFLALLWMRKRIELAFDMLNEASRAVRDMKSSVLFPVFYSVIGLIVFAVWIVIALYIYSVKDKSTKDMPSSLVSILGSDTYVDYSFNSDMRRAMVFHFVSLVYFIQVVIYFGFMVLAGSFADWYFSLWDMTNSAKVRGHNQAELSHAPILESLWRVLRFHVGSLAFGALLIIPVRLLRWSLMYLQKKTEAAQNPLTKCLFCCAECCLKCCECIIDTINKEGFIFTTIYGTNFCYSSMMAIKLVWKNLARAAMVEGISHYMELFGRIAISALTTGLCILVMEKYSYYSNHLSSIVLPAVVIFLLSYVIAAIFMLVFEVAVDTMFLCFLVDEEVHGGTPKFAHDDFTRKAMKHRNSV